MNRSRLTLVVMPAILLVSIVLPFMIYRDDLPDPMAIHWGMNGAPNGSMTPILAVLLIGGLYAAMVFGVHQAVRRVPDEGPSFVAGLFGIGVLLSGVSWLSVLANDGRTSWQQAGDVTLLQIGGVMLVSMGAGYVGWVWAGGNQAPPERAVGVAPTLDVANPEHAVWSGRGVGKLTTGIGLAMIVGGFILWGWAAVMFLIIGVVALLFAEVRATVGQKGVRISLGKWGYPGRTIPLASIARAEIETINPMAYGGWGYRVRPGVRAVVVRSGEALRLVRDDQSDLVVTVDDAATGAGLINAMLGASRS